MGVAEHGDICRGVNVRAGTAIRVAELEYVVSGQDGALEAFVVLVAGVVDTRLRMRTGPQR